MRRRRSDELPRYARDKDAQPFRFRRRYAYYLCGFLFVCWFLYPSPGRASTNGVTNWSNYAYSLYATDSATLCHALLLFDTLARLGSKADRVLFYPQHWDTKVTSTKDRDSQLLVLARDKYKVKLHPVKLLTVEGRTKGTMSGEQLHANPPPYACKVGGRMNRVLTALQMNGQGPGTSRLRSLWHSRLRTTIALLRWTRTSLS